MPPDQSVKTLRKMRADLAELRSLYRQYIELTAGKPAASWPQRAIELRQEISFRVGRAERAIGQTGLRMSMLPPPMVGGPAITGLTNLLFIHETPHGRVVSGVPAYVRWDDLMETADGLLASQEAEAERRRWNVLYWGDRVLSLVLGFPAYLIAKIIGADPEDFERTAVGRVIRALAPLASAAVAAYGIHEKVS